MKIEKTNAGLLKFILRLMLPEAAEAALDDIAHCAAAKIISGLEDVTFKFHPPDLPYAVSFFKQEEVQIGALSSGEQQLLLVELISIANRVWPISVLRSLFLDAVNMAVPQQKYKLLSRVMCFLYAHSLDDDLLLGIFAEYAQTPESRLNTLSNMTLLGYYLSLLVCSEKIDEARDCLSLYRRLFPAESLYRLPPAAWLAHRQGWDKSALASPAFLYEVFLQNQESRAFEQLVQQNSVAVVGHGPQEIGRGKGREIDSHDLVARCHYFEPIEPQLQKDYGSRTDIVSLVHLDAQERQNFASFSFPQAVFFYTGIDQSKLTFSQAEDVELLAKLFREKKTVMGATSRKDFKLLAGLLDYCLFASGTLFCASIKLLRPELAWDDIYGFSFKTPGLKRYADSPQPYYKEKKEWREEPYPENHPLQMEKAIMEKLFGVTVK